MDARLLLLLLLVGFYLYSLAACFMGFAVSYAIKNNNFNVYQLSECRRNIEKGCRWIFIHFFSCWFARSFAGKGKCSGREWDGGVLLSSCRIYLFNIMVSGVGQFFISFSLTDLLASLVQYCRVILEV